jgi:HEAT repeat protein
MSPTLANPYTAFAIDLAIDVVLKGTIVIGLAGLASFWLREASAATRHAVWSAALACLLLLPILSANLPAWKLEPFYVAMEVDSKQPVANDEACCDETCCSERFDEARPAAATRAVDEGVPPGPAATADRTATAERGAAGRSGAGTALVLWLLGIMVLLGRLGVDVIRIQGITRRAARASAEAGGLARRLATNLGIHTPVRVLVSDEIKVPLTWGFWNPVVILPEAGATWPSERTRVVLLHELAHIKRWDYPVLLMAEVVCAIYWFNPFVWIGARFNAMERERACDDQALHVGVRSDVYATHLFEIARAQVTDDTPRAAFAMGQASNLATRIRSILARGLDRAPLSQSSLVSTALAALLVAFPISSVEVWGWAQSNSVAQGVSTVEQRLLQLEDDDPLVRRHAAWALGELESERAVRPLIEHLEDNDADVRLVAAWALGEIKDDAAIYPLTQRLDDRDPLVREMAALALGEIEHFSAVAPLTEALEQYPELREPVIWALGEIDGHEAEWARDDVFQEWGRRPYPNDEVWTGHLGSDAARPLAGDISDLVDALNDDDPRTRRSAAEWLGLRGDPRAVDSLLDALRDPDPSVRAMAIWSLDEINPSRHQNT